MLIDGLIKLLWFLLDIVLDLLPPWSVEIPLEVEVMFKNMRAYNEILPVFETISVINACIVTVFALLIVKLIIKVADYITNIIP